MATLITKKRLRDILWQRAVAHAKRTGGKAQTYYDMSLVMHNLLEKRKKS